MAQILEEFITIRLSKLVKNNKDNGKILISDELILALEQVAEELVDAGVIVEVETTN
jgi:hypothetical protein